MLSYSFLEGNSLTTKNDLFITISINKMYQQNDGLKSTGIVTTGTNPTITGVKSLLGNFPPSQYYTTVTPYEPFKHSETFLDGNIVWYKDEKEIVIKSSFKIIIKDDK